MSVAGRGLSDTTTVQKSRCARWGAVRRRRGVRMIGSRDKLLGQETFRVAVHALHSYTLLFSVWCDIALGNVRLATSHAIA